MKKRFSLVALILFLTLAAHAVYGSDEKPNPPKGGTPKGFEISQIKSLEEDGLPYVSVSFHVPKPWGDPPFTVTVNGEKATFKKIGWGDIASWPETTFRLFPGKTGVKDVVVKITIKGKAYEARRTFTWNPSPMIGILDSPGESELLLKRHDIKVWTFMVDHIQAHMNGEERVVKAVTPAKESLAFFTVSPDWKGGRNTLSIKGTASDGKTIEKEFSFIDVAHGAVSQGEVMKLSYFQPRAIGAMPLSLHVSGDAVKPMGVEDTRFYRMDNEGWLFRDTVLTEKLNAMKPGEARVKVLKTGGSVVQEFVVTVAASPR